MSYSMPELIRTKRDGGVLTAEELKWIITEYTAYRIPDYQMSSLLMAIIFRGLNAAELAAWTDAMLHSGDVLDLSARPCPRSTSTRPAVSATRSASRWRRWSRPAESPSR